MAGEPAEAMTATLQRAIAAGAQRVVEAEAGLGGRAAASNPCAARIT